MTIMKKHPFLNVDYHSTVKLSTAEKQKIDKWLQIGGKVLENLFDKNIVPFKKPETVHVSLLICGDARIKELNLEHRNKDKVTDVLSFPAHENLRKNRSLHRELFLGDLAICHQQTKRQAKEFNITYFDEFIHLFFHGVIHLIGYDHELGAKEEKLMQKWEQLALDKFSEIKNR